MTLIGFGCKTAEKYIPNMKELILSGEKQQTIRLCKCEQIDYGNNISLVNQLCDIFGENRPPHQTKICKYHRLKPEDKLQLYWKPRTKQCEKLGEAKITDLFDVAIKKIPTGYALMEGSHGAGNKDFYSYQHFYEDRKETVDTLIGDYVECDWLEDLAKRDGFRDNPSACYGCKFFVSYRQDYEDSLEPDDCGFCLHPQQDEYDSAGAGSGCDFREGNPSTATEKFFKFFDEMYDLSTPKKFVVVKWELEKEE